MEQEQDIIGGNKLIAEFMGYKGVSRNGEHFDTDIEETYIRLYQTRWDWLMPAWKKFYDDVIHTEWYEDNYTEKSNTDLECVEYSLTTANIIGAYKHFVNLLQWHNQNKQIMEQDIIEGNKLIAEFMGYDKSYRFDNVTLVQYNIENKTIADTDLKYHSSWDWLMPVVEKIEKDYEVKIEDVFCEITLNDGEGSCTGTIDKDGDTKIEAVWLAVVFFIKWYNQNK